MMKGSFVVGRIKGIQIEVNISWFVIFGLMTFLLATGFFPQSYPEWNAAWWWIMGGLISLLLFVSVLLHELSHSLVSQSLGMEVNKITLFIFGGVAQIESEPDEPLKELKIAIAGPAMSIFLALLLLLLASIANSAGAPEYFIVLCNYLATLNLVLALFNLVPAFPLDGGRVLRALIWHFQGDMHNATRIASSLGSAFGYSLMFLGIYWVLSGFIVNGIWSAFIGWFITQASQSSYQQTRLSDIFNKIKIESFMTQDIITLDYHISVQNLIDHYFYKYKFSIFPVIKDEQVIGIVSLDNINKVARETWPQTTVGNISTPLENNLLVAPDETVAAAMNKLFCNKIGRVLVMNQGKLIGLVSRTDILNYIRIHTQLNG